MNAPAFLLAVVAVIFSMLGTGSAHAAEIRARHLLVGGPAGADPVAIFAEISTGEAGLAALGLVATLIGYHFTLGKYIRQQAGVRDTQDARIINDPLLVTTPTRFATHAELAEVKADVDALREEMSRDLEAVRQRMEQRFDQLNNERRVSIAGLHAKLDQHEHADAKRAEVIMEKIGELRGLAQAGGNRAR